MNENLDVGRLGMSPDVTASATRGTPSLRYSWYVVFVLMLCFTLSYIDRQILALVIGPIKKDLGISDTVVGLLMGFAFAVFFAIMGLPFGRMVDTRNRRNLIAAGVLFWSLMTALCSFAKSFGTLFAARMGVGVGEAALGPGALSLITDYFPKDRLAKALSVYSMGVFLGSGLALIVGGSVVDAIMHVPEITLPWVGSMVSWRAAFLIVGLPGVIAVLLVMTIREPVRKGVLRDADGRVSAPTMREVIHQIGLRWQSAVGLAFAIAFLAMTNYASGAWVPAYFMRIYHWSAGEAGAALGWIIVIFGCLGMYVGGSLCDGWQKKGQVEAPLRVGLIGSVGTAVLFPAAMLMPSATLSLVFLAPAVFFQAMPAGSAYAALQLIFPNQFRGQVNAVLAFLAVIVGLTLGPLLPGVFNDYLFQSGMKVGNSVAITIAIGGVAAALLFRSIFAPYRRHFAMLNS